MSINNNEQSIKNNKSENKRWIKTKWSWTTLIELSIMQIMMIGITELFINKLFEVAWVSIFCILIIICFSVSEISRQIRYYAAISVISILLVVQNIGFGGYTSGSIGLDGIVLVGYIVEIVIILATQIVLSLALNIKDKLKDKQKK